MLQMSVRVMHNLQRDLKIESQHQSKAFETAVRVEGFRLRRQLQKEIRAGAPGGQKFTDLSFLARGLGSRTNRRFKPNRPLIRLANAISYEVDRLPNFRYRFGFKGNRTPKFFRYLAEKHQKGYTIAVTKKMRSTIIREGARRGKIDGGSTPFFLRKTTQEFSIPARPIIEPFWNKHRVAAWRNIRENFRRKLKGERI